MATKQRDAQLEKTLIKKLLEKKAAVARDVLVQAIGTKKVDKQQLDQTIRDLIDDGRVQVTIDWKLRLDPQLQK